MLEHLARRAKLLSAPFLGASLLLGSTVTLPSAAHAQAGAVQGGGGGHYFELACGPGRVLVGLRGSAGILLDSIQAICANVGPRNLTMQAALHGPVIGSDRPMDKWVECPVGYAVTHAVMGLNDDHPHLGAIRLICTELVNREAGGTKDLLISGSGNLEGYSSPQLLISSTPGSTTRWSECPGGYAIGVRGRSDRYVDAFGLMCGPKPAATDPNVTAGRTLGKRKRPKIDMRRDADDLAASSIPQTQQALDLGKDSADATISSIPEAPRTLGKRKRPGTLSGSATAGLINSESSFQTFNFPDRFIRHANWLGFVEPAQGNSGSITYRVVPGLGGRCVSLESADHPGHFLRHQDWRIKLSPLDSDGNMRADATFCMVPGMASTAGVSFEAISAGGHFIRHRNFELWLDRPDGSDQYRNDATFLAAPPGGAALGVR